MCDMHALIELAEEAERLKGNDDDLSQRIRSDNLRTIEAHGLTVADLLGKNKQKNLQGTSIPLASIMEAVCP
jgi:hypothetical protein